MSKSVIDERGFRAGVGIILMNDESQLFWAKRVGQPSYQFPQGGLLPDEAPEVGMYRELYEEIGLQRDDVEIVASTAEWLTYRLPKRYIRHHSMPLCVGQKQKWFLLRLRAEEAAIRFDNTQTPEFDDWIWVDYWRPLKEVIEFKKRVYRMALKEFQAKVAAKPNQKRRRGFMRRSKRRPY